MKSIEDTLRLVNNIVEKYNFQGIIFPSDENVNNFLNSSAADICSNRGIWLKRLQIKFELVE